LLNLYVKFVVRFPLNAGSYRTTARSIRVMIVKDKTDIVSGAGTILNPAYVGSSNIMTSFTIWDQKEEIKVLYDEIWPVQNDGLDGARTFSFKIPLQYIGTFATSISTDLDANRIKFLALSDEGAGPNNPEMYMNYRITYKDS